MTVVIAWYCSGVERGIHADVRSRGVLPTDLPQEVDKPWGATGWVWSQRLLHSEAWLQALLDHKELLGKAVGRTRLLPALQGS